MVRIAGGGGAPPTSPPGSQPPDDEPPFHRWVNLGPAYTGGPDQWDLVPMSQWMARAMGLIDEESESSLAAAQLQAATANRRINLDRALGALSAFNQAQRSADERRVSAMDQARQLTGLLVPRGTEFFPGMAPGGALSQATERAGLAFDPARVVEREFQPQALAEAPDIPPQVTAMLQGLQGV